MAFWGVEVKPGKPITHSCEKATGRLRISQATLGFGESSKSSVVQCNVGNRSPVLLCVLLPGRMESSHIELEFEEADDVVFSVVGPRSVYLTGYYVRQSGHSNGRSDTESYGVDIEHSPTDRSNYNSEGDEGYDDSFINDDECQVSSPGSPVFYSKGMDEVMPEKDKPKSKKGRNKQGRKRQWVSESDNDASSPKREEEAGEMDVECQKDAKKTTCGDDGEMEDEAKDDDICGSQSKQKADPLDISDKIQRVTQLPSLDEEGTEINKMKSHDQEKPRKKRKQCPVTKRTNEVQTDNEDPAVPRVCKEHEAVASADLMGVGGDHLMTALELDSANGPKLKERCSELLEGELTEGTDEKFQNITEDLVEPVSLQTDNLTENQPAENGECEQQQTPEETSMEECGPECHNVQSNGEVMQEVHIDGKTDDLPAEIMQEVCDERKTDDLPAQVMQIEHTDRETDNLQAEVMQEEHAERKIDDLPAENGDNEEGQIDSNITDTKVTELLANGSQDDKVKKKRKKKKSKGKGDLDMSAIQMLDNQETETETESTKIVPFDTRTLSNGLTIKDLSSGPPGGRVAVPGKKIKIHYNGMLKESGLVYDSNVGGPAFKFLLGDKAYIDGWNVGIDGMRVGDKRRLIIPPSMGYGDVQVGADIPPNSWLIYDIELVKVYH
ncbi:peptidyl-prolyl cis-trans isomerase FKBP53-like [Salvia splendens]|uniref:peptidyl-prolyl cis-trans isomerase FKBP53-like n=1 Tax=Salvia splendens TaxID=180675 RepID=UPI001C25BBA5|nr:peptidyl-prolyl cis-trans isomerase FKBP53-like [Salvia splendens]